MLLFPQIFFVFDQHELRVDFVAVLWEEQMYPVSLPVLHDLKPIGQQLDSIEAVDETQ